jgi:hypothetical protein
MAKTTLQIRLPDEEKAVYKKMAELARRSLSSWVSTRLQAASNAEAVKAKMKPPFPKNAE